MVKKIRKFAGSGLERRGKKSGGFHSRKSDAKRDVERERRGRRSVGASIHLVKEEGIPS